MDTARPRSLGRPLSRRRFLGLAAGTAAGATLARCGVAPGGTGPHGSGTVQLVYQDWRTPWFPGLAQEMLRVFHDAHPNIHVFYAPDPELLDETMAADFEAGTAPDVMAGCCDFIAAWAQGDYLLDLRPFVAADLDRGTIADWDAAQVQALHRLDGLQYALPKYHGALALFYNKDLFDERGVDYPDASWDHDDYRDAMRRLSRERGAAPASRVWGSMIDVSWERIQVHVNGWGGHLVDPADPTRSRMADPEALAALRWIRDRMWGDHTMAGVLDVQNRKPAEAFVERRVAMVEEGSWALKDILEAARFRVGVAPLPRGPERRVTLATTDGFAINAATRHPEAAWELLKFLTSREYGLAMARAHLLQPARASLIDKWIELVRDQYGVRAAEMDLEVFAEGHVEGYSVTAEVFANMAPARRLAREAWERILVLGQDPVETMLETSLAIEDAQRSFRETGATG